MSKNNNDLEGCLGAFLFMVVMVVGAALLIGIFIRVVRAVVGF